LWSSSCRDGRFACSRSYPTLPRRKSPFLATGRRSRRAPGGRRLCIDGVATALYDVVALPGFLCPQAGGFRTDEIRRVISIG